jgi:aryl-phospho-beta-D-glucosidase BglC (GH1 family)
MKPLVLLGLLVVMARPATADVPPDRLAVLSHGVNLIDVFNKNTSDVQREITDVKAVGLRHIRIFIDPAWVWRPGEPQHLDAVIKAAIAAKLGVILCMQSYPAPFKSENQVPTWIKAWLTIAQHYANTSPDYLFFELANEPGFDERRWPTIQETLRQQVRAFAPNHTLLLTGSPTSTSYALAALPPSPDNDVAYVFHEYQPMAFTHQSADWASHALGTVHDLQYPPQQPNLDMIEHRADPSLRANLQHYGELGRNVIVEDVQPALQWAQKNHAHLVVTEFGVYRAAPPRSRAAWFRDVRTILESHDIGWSVWEYNGGFGIKPELDVGCSPLSISLGLCR